MATGSSTYDGLAMGLFGEYQLTAQTTGYDVLTITGVSGMGASDDFFVVENSSGTELFYIRSDGFTRINPTTTVSAFGFDVRHAGSSTTGFNCAGNFQETLGAISVDSAQCYALRAHFDGSSATSIGGGREACLALYANMNSSAGGSSHSIIAVDDAGSDVQAFISFMNIGTSGGCIVANAAAASTLGIRIYIDSDAYYIMVTSCVD